MTNANDAVGVPGKKSSEECPKLIDVDKLERLIARRPDDQGPYLRERWLQQVLWWDCRSRGAKWKYFLSRTIVVAGGAIVPFLTSFHISDTATNGVWFRTAGSIVAVIVAISAGVEALHNWGAIWLEKRKAAELLKVEGWLFLNGAGAYAKEKYDTEEAFAVFVANVESRIASEIGDYTAIARPDPKE